MTRPLSLAFLLVLASPALADEPKTDALPVDEPPVPAAQTPPSPDEATEPASPTPDVRIDALEQRMQALEDALDEARDDNKYLEERVQQLMPLTGKLGGYLDLGAFATSGNGAGTRSDIAGVYFPEYGGRVPGSWVFMGDPLSTTVNSRGDVAETGESRAIAYDPIDSRGKSTALVNAVNLAVFTGIGSTGSAQVSIDFLPRARDISEIGGLFSGDSVDVKLAFGEWKPELDGIELALQAGKFDSVVGFEYRSLESPDRTGVTPSLICRYTCGRPIGLKARGKLNNGLVLNVAVTNGSHFHEGFPFAAETDRNHGKTAAGRLSYLIAGGKAEVGVSGAYGAQDFQSSSSVAQWHAGVDLHVDVSDVELTAEYVQGNAEGETSAMAAASCDLAPCLDYKGAYGLVSYRLSNTWIPYARVDWRDALHESGASFVYISELVRGTIGVRAEIGARVIVKLEGTLNRELGRVPQFPNDVVTSSLVIKL